MSNKFTVRVVLYKAEENDYEILHSEMNDRSFSRTIMGNDNIEYYLPDAEYNKIGNFTDEQIRQSAIDVALTTGKKYCILITPSTGRFWSNLKAVDNN